MLVMDRKQGERIRINDTTEIVILEVNQQQVTIAVETSSAAEQTGKESSNEKK
jgi:carbon storage regulator CsrA